MLFSNYKEMTIARDYLLGRSTDVESFEYNAALDRIFKAVVPAAIVKEIRSKDIYLLNDKYTSQRVKDSDVRTRLNKMYMVIYFINLIDYLVRYIKYKYNKTDNSEILRMIEKSYLIYLTRLILSPSNSTILTALYEYITYELNEHPTAFYIKPLRFNNYYKHTNDNIPLDKIDKFVLTDTDVNLKYIIDLYDSIREKAYSHSVIYLIDDTYEFIYAENDCNVNAIIIDGLKPTFIDKFWNHDYREPVEHIYFINQYDV